MKCENCDTEHEGKFGSGRFCSRFCAFAFSGKKSKGTIKKWKSEFKNENKPYHKIKRFFLKCIKCEKYFNTNNKNQHFCSIRCSSLANGGWLTVHNKLSSFDWSEIHKKAYRDGKHQIHGGTTKWLAYKKIKVQGTYELRTCIILDKWKEEGKIKDWEYTKDRIKYIGPDNKEHSYLIDFKIFKNEKYWYYLEVKGRIDEWDEYKWKAVKEKGYDLQIWKKEDIKINELMVLRSNG